MGWGSSATGSGENLTVNFGLGLKAGFLGLKNVYMFAFTTAGAGSGWYTQGIWTGGTTPDPPGPLAVQPSGGTGLVNTFTFSGQSYDGATYLGQAYMLFNTVVDGYHACYMLYDRGANAFYLTNDAATQWMGGYAPGTPGATIQNSQCTVDIAHTTITTVFDRLTIQPKITFSNSFSGSKNMYLYLTDQGGQVSGWQQIGTWMMGAPPLVISTLSPLPYATVGAPYPSQTFNATGGTPPNSWSLVSGLPPGMSFIAGTLSGAPNSIIPPNPTTMTVRVTDSASQTSTKDFSLTINAPSQLPLSAAPSSLTVPPAVNASSTIMVTSGAGFSGSVSFAVSGLPAGAAAVFSPTTLNNSGSTTLIITPSANSATGVFPITVTAQSGSLSYSTMLSLTVSSASANIISPSPGTILAGSSATFVWDSGSGASQYRLFLGSTPGGSDYYSAYTSTNQATIANIPSGSPSKTIYVTLGSLIAGAWQPRSYIYRVGSTSPVVPTSVAPRAQATTYYVLNNNKPQTWPYCITVTGSCPGGNADAGAIDFSSLAVDCPGVSVRIPSIPSNSHPDDISSFDVTFTADYSAKPRACTLSLTFDDGVNIVPLSLANAVRVYDATPTITYVQQYPPATAGGPFYITLYGTNFGPTTGNVAVCAADANPCNSSDVGVSQTAPFSYWSDIQINVLLTPSPSSSGIYDVQVTSNGETGSGLGFQPLPQITSNKSNRGKVSMGTSNLLTVTLSPSMLNLSTGDTNGFITTTVTPPTSFQVFYNPALASPQPGGSACNATANMPPLATAQILVSPSNCSGVFNIYAFANLQPSGNIAVLTVPPQALIWQMNSEAGGFTTLTDPGNVTRLAVGVAGRNRFSLTGFNGVSTYNGLVDLGQVASGSRPSNGIQPELDSAAAVFTGAVRSDFVGGAPCYWSPQYQLEFIPIQNQFQTNPTSTTFPAGLLFPSCYPTSQRQIVWKTSMPNNTNPGNQGVYLNAPAFMFVRQRSPSAPAIVQIP